MVSNNSDNIRYADRSNQGNTSDQNNERKVDALLPIETEYFLCPNSLFALPLNIHEKLALAYFYRCGNNGTQIFPSYSKIAGGLSISRRQAVIVVNKLLKDDWIHKELRYEKSNLYSVNQDKIEKAPPSAYHAPVNIMHQTSEQPAPANACDSPASEQHAPIQLTTTANPLQLTKSQLASASSRESVLSLSIHDVNNCNFLKEGTAVKGERAYVSLSEADKSDRARGEEKVPVKGDSKEELKEGARREPPEPGVRNMFVRIHQF